MARVIVVGGGLSGLSAAHTVLEHGAKVVLLDKNNFLGGNSTKATSGINGALTRTQVKLGIPDSAEIFYEDTSKSARELVRPELVKVLTGHSASAVEWLQDKFKLDLSLVSRLGGHSQPRTHRGKERFPGMTITYALMEKLEDLARSSPDQVVIHKKANVKKLLQDSNGAVVGVEYEMNGQLHQLDGAVVLATGGYAADFTDTSLLKKYRPDLIHLPTTNGDYSTGDGLKMTLAIGGKAVDLEKVQVHPTGLVDPNEPDAKVKFLAAEALRGCGGILLNNQGQRFCDELGHRDYVTGQIWKDNKTPVRLVLNGAAGKEIEWHCKHYMGRGLMKKFNTGEELAKEIGVPASVLEKTFNDYNSFATNKNDPFGKKYFHNLPWKLNDEFYVAIITPVLHYTMGGLEISPAGEAQSPSGVISGLFVTGELAGGVHGANRLGGSSLLGCVVFGRVAGGSAAKYLTSHAPSASVERAAHVVSHLTASAPVSATVNHGGLQTRVDLDPNQKRFTLEVSWDPNTRVSTTTPATATLPASASTTAPSAAPLTGTTGGASQKQEYTWEEVAKHNTEQDCWVVVNGEVLDVTKFLADHPGGKKAILIYAGRDATEEFNMLHKPDVVEKYAPYAIIGTIKGGGSAHVPAADNAGTTSNATTLSSKILGKLQPSNKQARNSGGTADVLPAERAKASFDVVKLTNLLDGGAENTKRRHFIISAGEDLTPDLAERHNWDRDQYLKEHIKHFIGVHQPYPNFIPTRKDINWMSENSVMGGSLMNHMGLFLSTINTHASDKQKEWWFMRARHNKIIGCYAQTELGHGSNVRGLQTTAIYDKTTQEFVLNTPTLQSIKWWPGTLGKVATHAIIYAQLIIDGKEYGVHNFMLQLRDENHKLLPGIETGDLGPKLGDNSNDTGYCILDNVRIPREFMFAKYQEVTPEGVYKPSADRQKNEKLIYTTMIFTRASMMQGAAGKLARAVTTAVRYSCVRKQGFVNTRQRQYQAPEVPIIDYTVQRYRLFRQLALTYAIKFTGSWMMNRMGALDKGNEKLADALLEIAATSGGLKALCTYLAWYGIEDCRKCCGGNGYLLTAGLAPLAADYVWQITAEGDWIILMLQTARFLLKALKDAASGQKLAEPVVYLKNLLTLDLSNPQSPQAQSAEDFKDLDFLRNMFHYAAAVAVGTVGQQFQEKLAQKDFDAALNACANDLCNAVRLHCFAFMVTNFVSAVKDVEDSAIRAALSKLCALFAVSNILDDSNWTGLVTASQMSLVKQASYELMEQLRPDAVALVDAFDIPDHVLASTIGRKDGNVYEALFESALKSSLNKHDPFVGYDEVLRPLLDLDFLKQGNRVPKM